MHLAETAAEDWKPQFIGDPFTADSWTATFLEASELVAPTR